MQEAWSYQRKGFFNARMFARDLRQAWHTAKLRIMQAVQSEADRIREAITVLGSKDTWSQKDYARNGVLRAALSAAISHENKADDYTAKRALIEAAGGRFCAVTFTKADGSERTMRVQPAALKGHVKGAAASLSAKQAQGPSPKSYARLGRPRQGRAFCQSGDGFTHRS